MSSNDQVLRSLLAAASASPDDLVLRLHVAAVLLDHGRVAAALEQCSAVLARDPTDAGAAQLLIRATAALGHGDGATAAGPPGGVDWSAYENQLADIVAPAFVTSAPESAVVQEDVVDVDLRLADVGGMEEVKRRLEVAFLGPMRHPELARRFGKRLSGGLLLYGPPGCGKTFLARAVAGELGARFYHVSLVDVLDMFVGQSERNMHEVFEVCRRNQPCVLFFDEIDALGQKRSQLRGTSAMRSTVNQLLSELDSAVHRNDGVFVLAATNHPWDVDSALRRPGRFDRMLLVRPPDEPARGAILRLHLRDRPLTGIDLDALVRRTDAFSGADLAHLCDSAAERALEDTIRTGTVRMITMADFDAVLREIRPSTGAWLQTARNVAMFANEGGAYDELLDYLRSRKLA